jgi:deazaflavin-dependent oxidoreductase (nitroreductase family)
MILFDNGGTGRLMFWEATGALMDQASINDFADKKVLYLTTIGRRTGLPRQIEIWFVVYRDRFYLVAETGEAAAWVKNLRSNPEVTVRIGERQIGAKARVLDRETDRELWDQVAAVAHHKYGWGDGLPIEITPFTHTWARSEATLTPADDR